MEFRIEHIAGKTCRVWTCEQGGPVIYWGTARQDDNEDTAVADLLKELTKGKAWTLVAYEVEHWNQDFSPWAVPSVFGQEEFTGGAKETLNWLTDQCIPFIERNVTTDCSVRMIGGYSLVGLFSLFAFYESREFSGVASCSGSLWYPGWKEYAQRQCAPEHSMMYFSLGQKEEKTRNRKMAAIGEMTRWQHERAKNDNNVRYRELVWQNGGHFTDVEKRIAHGFAWLIGHAQG